MTISTPEQAKTLVDLYRLPGGATCVQCSNYRIWCREVFAGSKPLREDNDLCAAGRASERYNIDFRKPTEFMRTRRKAR